MSAAVVVIPTGTANLASVCAALRRLGADPVVSRDVRLLRSAGRVVLPGVGSFGMAMGELDRRGLREVLRTRLVEGRATLAICVGMQLLAESSEESLGVDGIGHLTGVLSRFPDSVNVPQLGWNRITAEADCRFLADGWAYFANSYRLDTVPAGWSAALSDHGATFVAGLERGEVLACQFHPELSGAWGEAMLGRWLRGRPG